MALVLRRCAPQLPPLFVIWDYNRGAAIYRDELSGPVQPASQPGPMLISPRVGTAWARSAPPQHPGRLQAPPTKWGVLKPASTRPRADPGQLKPRGEGFVPARQSSAPPRCLLAPPDSRLCAAPQQRQAKPRLAVGLLRRTRSRVLLASAGAQRTPRSPSPRKLLPRMASW